MALRNKLLSVEIKGYKSFDSLGQKFTPGALTVLIGANGAGKSNLVSLFKMISFMMRGSFQNFVGLNGGARSLLNFGPKKTKQIECKISFETHDSIDVYTFVVTYAAGDTFIFTEEELIWSKEGEENPYQRIFESGNKESSIFTNNNTGNNGPLKVIEKLLKRIQVFQFHDTSTESGMRGKSLLSDNKYLRSDGSNLATILYYLSNNETTRQYFSRIENYVRLIMPEFKCFILEPDSLNENSILLKWMGNDSDYVFGPHQLSDGSLRFIALITLLLRPQNLLPSVVVIDEPELGLHPAAISILASIMNGVKESTQIIVGTQSVNLLNEVDPLDIVVVEKDIVSGGTKLLKPEPETLDIWLEEYSLGELWEKNVLGGRP